MKYLALAFALAALLTGLKAAIDWYKSSRLVPEPGWPIEPGDSILAHIGWISGILETGRKSSALNRTAAIWTAVSVLLSALSSVVGAFPVSN
jgi:hypothetical protein